MRFCCNSSKISDEVNIHKPKGLRTHSFHKPFNTFQVIAIIIYFITTMIFFTFLYLFSFNFWIKFIIFAISIFIEIIALFNYLATCLIDTRDYGVLQDKTEYFCKRCKLSVSNESKHCRTCNKCILGFDHHCPWLNTCIGAHNKDFYLCMLFSLVLLTLIYCYASIQIICQSSKFVFMFNLSFAAKIIASIQLAVMIVCFYQLFMLFLLHLVLRLRKLSTYSFLNMSREISELQRLRLSYLDPQNLKIYEKSKFEICLSGLKDYWNQIMYPCLAWNIQKIHSKEITLKNIFYQNNNV